MDASTTGKQAKIEQCRKNARAKSEQKRQAAFQAIQELEQEHRPVTKATVVRRAGVSAVFLRSHPDILQAMRGAEQRHQFTAPDRGMDRAKDQMIAALRRRLEELKQALAAKETVLRQKQREIDHLYGKLAAGSPLTDAELRQQLQRALPEDQSALGISHLSRSDE